MRVIVLLLLVICFDATAQQHPIAFVNRQDVQFMRTALSTQKIFQSSFQEIKSSVDPWLTRKVDVPFPKDPAGGYTHDRHKENYMLVFNSGILYQLTRDLKYARLGRDIMLQYATLNPKLSKHPQATSSSPGHIFWQALNDANWLVYCGLGYDLLVETLTPAEKKIIVEGAFKPEVDFVTRDLESWFNLIHNHGVWACAGVGITGIATDRKDWTDMALKGTTLDGKSGFLAQMDGLFAPDGYYTEGPYYVRYAMLPYFLFANALQKARPAMNIFQYRSSILQKALSAALQQTNINGTFFPINDDLKEKDYTSNELVTAIGIAWDVYGADPGLLPIAKAQGRVLINRGGAAIAQALETNKNISAYYPYKTVEYVDGAKGDEGGISILRMGTAPALQSLIFKYASHGLSHGHYDQLGISLFDQGNEILQDYGSVRFIGVEQKYGGRYLKENHTYAAQTIAHNTLVVDEASHFDGDEDIAQKYHGNKLYSSLVSKNFQSVSAYENSAYEGVKMKRSIFQIKLPGARFPLIIDMTTGESEKVHQYDLPFQYNGQVIRTSFKYRPQLNELTTMGKKNGYQFLWKEAEAKTADSLLAFTFLKGNTYYTITTAGAGNTDVFLTRAGANDPEFNLRREPSYILRRNSTGVAFLNAIEAHGNFDPIAEFSTGSYPGISALEIVERKGSLSVIRCRFMNKDLFVAENTEGDANASHNYVMYGHNLSWKGHAAAWFDGSMIK